MLSQLILRAAKNGDWLTVYVFLDGQIEHENTTKSEKSIVQINAQDDNGLTLFDYAITQKNAEAVRYLCSRGAKVSAELQNIPPIIYPEPIRPAFNPYYEQMLSISTASSPVLSPEENSPTLLHSTKF